MRLKAPSLSFGMADNFELHVSAMYAEAIKTNDHTLIKFIRKHWLNSKTEKFFKELDEQSTYIVELNFHTTYHNMVEAGLLRKHTKNDRIVKNCCKQELRLLAIAENSGRVSNFYNKIYSDDQKRAPQVHADMDAAIAVYNTLRISTRFSIQPLWSIHTRNDVFVFQIRSKHRKDSPEQHLEADKIDKWCRDELEINDFFMFTDFDGLMLCLPKRHADKAVIIQTFFNSQQIV